jgi:hypothetical protein
MPSEITAAIPDIQIPNTGHTYGTVKDYGCYKDRKEGQTFKYLGKISHFINQ